MERFTAEDFDGAKIARFARQCGMRYATLTARHHDGFSLYDTRGLNTYDAPHSAAKRDLIAEFVEGCRREDILPIIYHTTLDFAHPEFNRDFAAYQQYLRASVEILCTQYGDIGGLWFDGNWSRPECDWEEDALYGLIRRHQPEAMIINNTGLRNQGGLGHPQIDSLTYEQGRPDPINRDGMSKYLAGEMCQTLNRHWGAADNDLCYLSPRDVIENLAACRRVGANYLLNVGPTASGAIPDYEAACLRRVGEWVARHEDALRLTRPSTIRCDLDNDFVLEAEDGTLFYFVHNLGIVRNSGTDDVTVKGGRQGATNATGIKHTVKRVTWLDNGQELAFTQDLARSFLSFEATGYPYGTHHVVRVAKIECA